MKEWTAGREREAAPAAGFVSQEARDARNKGLYYLQFSNKTTAEMEKKLTEQGFSRASVSDAIEFLKSYRYLDDEDYARRHLEKNGRKKSRKQMHCELRQKGISEEILSRVFEDMPSDETASICALLEKKHYRGTSATREERQKVTAFLARKGFSYDAISEALIQYVEKDTV